MGERVSVHKLNEFTAGTKPWARFPASWVWCFCQIVGDDQLARYVMGSRLAGLVKLGEALLALGEVDPGAARLARRLQRPPRRRRSAKRSRR